MFKYEPLRDGRSIRLAHIARDTTARNNIRISLREASLDCSPQFQALSYTWGPPHVADDQDTSGEEGGTASDTRETFVLDCEEGLELPVTENLYYAILRLARIGPVPPIWIDAICINQADTAERSSQVSMMGEIYSSASRVVVWLGNRDPHPTFLWIHANQKIVDFLTAVCEGKRDQMPTREALQTIGLGSLHEWQDVWKEYARFYEQNRYFKRLWIIQETALARELVVFCGTHTLDWSRLVVRGRGWAAGSAMRQLHIFRSDHHPHGGLDPCYHGTRADFIPGRKDYSSIGYIDEGMLKYSGALGKIDHLRVAHFIWVLYSFARYSCTDKRDHVFAALAFCWPFFKAEGVALPMTPDYTMERTEEKRTPMLPSWVPDFSAPLCLRPLVMRGLVVSPTGDINPSSPQPVYDASRVGETWHTAAPFATVNGPRLVISGADLDTVKAVCSSNIYDPEWTSYCYLPYLQFIAKHLPRNYAPTGKAREEAFWRTLIGNYADDAPLKVQGLAYPAYCEVGSTTIRQHMLWHLAAATIKEAEGNGPVGLMLGTATMTETLLALGADEEGVGRNKFLPSPSEVAVLMMTFTEDVFSFIKERLPSGVTDMTTARAMAPDLTVEYISRVGTSREDIKMSMLLSRMGISDALPRRLYVTRAGYLGVGPPDVKPGDSVWVVLGARVPFVFRHITDEKTNTTPGSKKRLQLLRETYVHGAMNGEVLDNRGLRGRFQEVIIE
ncbi:Heterokaryon incompatibility protein (HET) domain containing protein [Naviculisporaceae sp. PSN 640]